MLVVTAKVLNKTPTEPDIVGYNFINSFLFVFFSTAAEETVERRILPKHLLEALEACIGEETQLQKTEM